MGDAVGIGVDVAAGFSSIIQLPSDQAKELMLNEFLPSAAAAGAGVDEDSSSAGISTLEISSPSSAMRAIKLLTDPFLPS